MCAITHGKRRQEGGVFTVGCGWGSGWCYTERVFQFAQNNMHVNAVM